MWKGLPTTGFFWDSTTRRQDRFLSVAAFEQVAWCAPCVEKFCEIGIYLAEANWDCYFPSVIVWKYRVNGGKLWKWVKRGMSFGISFWRRNLHDMCLQVLSYKCFWVNGGASGTRDSYPLLVGAAPRFHKRARRRGGSSPTNGWWKSRWRLETRPSHSWSLKPKGGSASGNMVWKRSFFLFKQACLVSS